MSIKKFFCSIVLPVILLSLPAVCSAIEALDLEHLLAQKQKITVIDIRSQELFKAGHIHGAINISANIIDRKQLPPLGQVIVCGDGFNTVQTMKAVEVLNSKKGISADFLEGGFAAWNSLNLRVSVRQGAVREQLNYVSYQELVMVAAENNDIVLVDVRRRNQSQAVEHDIRGEREDLSVLASRFPGIEIIGPGHLSLSLFNKSGNFAYVIIDSCDGAAEKFSRQLNRAGIRRNYILTGGELALQREGRSETRTMTFGQGLE